jgi:hypothetical protein
MPLKIHVNIKATAVPKKNNCGLVKVYLSGVSSVVLINADIR